MSKKPNVAGSAAACSAAACAADVCEALLESLLNMFEALIPERNRLLQAHDHGCNMDMNTIILARMDALDHGCTGDMYFIFLGQHGCSRSWMH